MRIRLFDNTRDVFAILRSANSVAAAVETGARPRKGDLVRLGIDPNAFGSIRRS